MGLPFLINFNKNNGSGSKSMLQGKPFVVSLSNHNGFPTRRHGSGRTENLIQHTF
ncbi:hypothetical protein [Moraxella lacunata]|uniref:hypothetical protein n=1 Tax=Moraxella lacunata TaxID=477 RepID=UPI003EE26C07